jgi:hypothetical protein
VSLLLPSIATSLTTLLDYNATYDNLPNSKSKSETPSKGAKADNYKRIQTDPKIAVYDGRYGAGNSFQTASLPIQVFDPVFEVFTSRLNDEAVNMQSDFLRRIGDFVDASSAIYTDEATRNEALRSILQKILGGSVQVTKNANRTEADGVFVFSINGIAFKLLIWESKNEIGEGGSDPSTQAGLSMRETWADSDVSVLRRRVLMFGADFDCRTSQCRGNAAAPHFS